MRRSTIMDVAARVIFHSAMVFSVYLLVAGHNHPGGGFPGGLVAGGAIAVSYLARGIDGVRHVSPLPPWMVLGGGLVVATITAIVPLVAGGEVLESGVATVDLPVFDTMKVSSVLAFEVGVYGVVVGLVLMVFEAVGEEAEAARAEP